MLVLDTQQVNYLTVLLFLVFKYIKKNKKNIHFVLYSEYLLIYGNDNNTVSPVPLGFAFLYAVVLFISCT